MNHGTTHVDAQPVAARWRVRDWFTALALALAVFAVSRAYALPLVGLHHDDGQYVVAAEALATGAGYRQLQAPGAPLQTKFPVLFPLVLAAAWKAAPALSAAVALMSALCSACLALTAAVLYFAARRRFLLPAWAAGPVVLAAFTLPALAGLAALVMSEPLFLLLVASGLAVLPGRAAPGSWWWPAGLLLGLAAVTRGIGLPMVIGLAGWCAWHRRWPTGFVVPALAPPAAWLAWSVAARGPAAAGDPLGYGTSYDGWLASVPLGAWPLVVRDNLLAVPVHGGHLLLQSAIWLLPAALRPSSALLVGAALVVLVAWGARRVGGPWSWALAGYLAATVAWPWPPSRFIVAVLPLALVLPWAAARERRRLLVALSVSAAALATANGGYALSAWRAAGTVHGLVLPAGAPAAWREYEALFGWIRQSTPRDAVVVSVAEPMVYLYADRVGVFPFAQRTIAINYSNPPSVGDDEDLEALLTAARATHVVRMPAPAWAHTRELDDVMARLRARAPGRLHRVYAGGDPRFEVFAVSPVGGRRE